MLKLFQFASGDKLPNYSPFCMKVETYLRMSRIPFEIVKCNNPRKAPKGKLPYIIDNNNTIADSSLIIDYLKEQYGDILDSHLTPKEKGLSLAIQRMLEEHCYWVGVYSRWIDKKYWPITKKLYFAKIPAYLRPIVSWLSQRNIKKQIYFHGMGRHNEKEIYQFGQQALHALKEILAKQDYLFGDTPSSIDACFYAFLANVLYAPIPSPLQQYAQSVTSFEQYCQRMHQRFYMVTY